MGTEGFSIMCGLASALSFGSADFCGGLATKRKSVISVILLSQLFGLVLITVLAVAMDEEIPAIHYLFLGGLGGIFGLLGLAALYSGLARGNMGVVAPLSAVIAAALPVIVGIFIEGMPSTRQFFGLMLALPSIWYLTGGGIETSLRRKELGLPVCAGLAFGLFFIVIDRVSDTAVLWPLVAARVVSISMLLTFMLGRGKIRVPSNNPIFLILMAGILDAGGNVFFAMASRLGRLDISVILASLYPLSTALLAWLILKENLTYKQRLGLFTTLIALVLIAS